MSATLADAMRALRALERRASLAREAGCITVARSIESRIRAARACARNLDTQEAYRVLIGKDQNHV